MKDGCWIFFFFVKHKITLLNMYIQENSRIFTNMLMLETFSLASPVKEENLDRSLGINHHLAKKDEFLADIFCRVGVRTPEWLEPWQREAGGVRAMASQEPASQACGL